MSVYRRLAGVLMLGWVMAADGRAQTTATPAIDRVSEANGGAGTQRSFVLVLGSSVEAAVHFNGHHNGDGYGEALEQYAHAHPGRYILFEQEGVVHRLDAEARLQQVETAYAPMQALSERQKALAAQQKPLAEQQRALAAEMRGASSPVEMQRIGAAQGSVGRQQGAIGARQGEIGRKQGVLGRALNAQVQALLDACLRDGSCPAVAR